jgi:hypothetical protein
LYSWSKCSFIILSSTSLTTFNTCGLPLLSRYAPTPKLTLIGFGSAYSYNIYNLLFLLCELINRSTLYAVVNPKMPSGGAIVMSLQELNDLGKDTRIRRIPLLLAIIVWFIINKLTLQYQKYLLQYPIWLLSNCYDSLV